MPFALVIFPQAAIGKATIGLVNASITKHSNMVRSILSISLLFISVSLFSQNLQTAISQYDKGESAEAKSFFKTVKSRSSDYEKAQYYLGRIAFKEEEYSDAIDYFKEAIDENDKSADYYAWLGNAYGVYTQSVNKIRQGFLAPKIKKSYEKAVAIDPKNLEAQLGLIEYYTQAPSIVGGSLEKALETAKTILTFNEKEGYLALSNVYQRDKKYDKAQSALVKLVAIDSTYAISLGTFYQDRELFEKAFSHFEQMRSSQPDNPNALYQIGRTSALSGLRAEQGKKALETYMTLEIQNGSPSYAAAKMRLAMIYEKAGDQAKAKGLYRASLDEDPNMQLAKDGLKRLR